MAHFISAIIGKAPINEASAIVRGLPVIYEGNFVIIPVPVELIWKLAGDDEPADDAATTIFNTSVPHQLANELGMASYALIETDYFGGVGEQNASFSVPMVQHSWMSPSTRHCVRWGFSVSHAISIHQQRPPSPAYSTEFGVGGRCAHTSVKRNGPICIQRRMSSI